MTHNFSSEHKKVTEPDNPVDVYMRRLGDAGLLDDISLSAFEKAEKETKKKAFLAAHQELLEVRKRSDSPFMPLAKLAVKREAGVAVDEQDIKIAVLVLNTFNRDIEKVIVKQGRKLLRELPVGMKNERAVVEEVIRPYPQRKVKNPAPEAAPR